MAILRDEKGRLLPGTDCNNPKGRGLKPDSITALLRQFALVEGSDGRSNRERVVRQLWLEAAAGNIHAMRLVFDRCDGLLKQTIEQMTKVEVVYEDWNDTEAEVAKTSAVPEGD